MNDLIPALEMSDAELMDVLQSSVYPGALASSVKLAIGWCRAARKDPLKKPVHIVPMSVKIAGRARGEGQYEWRDVIMPGINDYRVDAARTGEHVGNLAAEFGPMRQAWGIEYPEWCEFTVLRWRHGEARPFSSGRVYFLETYATAGKDSDAPNAMWRKRPRGQLEKCAEALALRRAFPEVGSAPTSDEMVGRTFEVDDSGRTIDAETGEIVGQAAPAAPASASGIKMPQARSGKKAAALTDDPSPTLAPQQPKQAQAETVGQQASAPAQPRAEPRPGMATDGERAYIRRKLGEIGISVEDACKDAGITDFEALTTDGFVVLKDFIAGAGAAR